MRPIGIFDSGFGGLTVARSVIDQLPHESVVYLGDTARQPYGPKPIARGARVRPGVPRPPRRRRASRRWSSPATPPSSAMLRDARERYDVPVVEVILPATRRAVAATRTGRIGRHLHPRHGRVAAPTTTRSPLHRTSTWSPGPARGSSTSSSAGSPAATSCCAVAHEYLDPLVDGRRRHPHPRLHPLPAADRRDLLRDGRRRHAGVQRRGVRQGRLQAAGAHRPDAARTGSRRTSSSPPDRPTSSRRSGGGSSARRWRSRSQFAGGLGAWHEAHGRRLLRLLPGPDSPASCYLARGRRREGRTWRILLDLGNGALGALQRYADPLDRRRGRS